MSRSTKLWFGVAALVITALLAVAADRFASSVMRALLANGGKWWWPDAANVTSTFTVLFTVLVPVFLGIAVKRRRSRRRGPASIEDELNLRKLRAKGARVQFR